MSKSLQAEERETIISWCDDDSKECWIYSSQQSLINKLLKNPLFRCVNKEIKDNYQVYPNPVSIEGFLPIRAITIRSKKRTLTPEQRQAAVNRLKHAREARKLTINSEPDKKLSGRIPKPMVE
jgi:hypothetical protein